MTRSDASIFNLESISDYLAFCQQALAEFENDQANVLRGFSAILAINHIPDWLQYKLSASQRSTLGISGQAEEPVINHFEAQNADLKLIRSIANGFKHLRPMHSTQRVSGYEQGPYGVGPFGAPYLLIDKGEECDLSVRWAVGLGLCKKVFDYWQQTLQPILEEQRNDRH